MKSRGFTLLVAIGTLGVTGAVLGRVASPAWRCIRAAQPALSLDSTMAAAGQGLTLALLGGFRALVADVAWIRMYVLWEKRDLPATQTLIRAVGAVDPRPLYFWLNGSRILAYDLPVWRIVEAGGFETVPAPEQERIRREQATLALKYLEAAKRFHRASPDLWIEQANIQLNALKDLSAAAQSYRTASELPDAPYYASRMYAELLRRSGRKPEALAWLVRLHPTLPRNDEAAAADVVLGRIRDLERELGVPPARAYRPPP